MTSSPTIIDVTPDPESASNHMFGHPAPSPFRKTIKPSPPQSR
jgi:hypothetical protein